MLGYVRGKYSTIPIPGSEVGTVRPDPDISPRSMNVGGDDVSIVYYCWIDGVSK